MDLDAGRVRRTGQGRLVLGTVVKHERVTSGECDSVQHLREEQEVLLTVREEITRVNSDLSSDDKKRKQEGRARLRTLSQHRERGDGGDGDA